MYKAKKNLRAQFLELRKNLTSYDVFIKSWYAQENFLNSHLFRSSKTIGLYYPIHNEVQTFRILNASLLNNKMVCLPKIVGNDLFFYKFSRNSPLKIGKYNILEPDLNENEVVFDLDIVITPGIVFNTNGVRIGYGKGYYDRFLQKLLNRYTNSLNSFNIKKPHNPKFHFVGLAYDFQIVESKLEYENHDIKMHAIVTNKSILYF